MKQLYDVIIIGGGVVGSAIAREMSRYRLKIGVLEKNLDVCYETSGRNSGVVHGGFCLFYTSDAGDAEGGGDCGGGGVFLKNEGKRCRCGDGGWW